MRTLHRRLVRVAAAAVAVVGWGAVIVAPHGASAAIVTTPTDLSFGDQYRLAFVTSTTRDPTSSDIGVYNMFVTTAANTQADLVALGTTWTAIGSTFTTDARDNTGTNPSSTGVPIYRLDGTKIADNNADLWDGSIFSALNIHEDGSGITTVNFVWTGSTTIGTCFTFCLGISNVAFGATAFSDGKWINFGPSTDTDIVLGMYALSAPLTVVPLPGALILFGSGLACLAVLRRRNRSVRPA